LVVYIPRKKATFNPYFSLGVQMLLSSILLLTITETTDMAVPLSTVPAASWWSIAYLVIIGSIISFLCLYLHVAKLPEINSIYAYVNPIVAVLLGAVIFGETSR
jgi:drug/metabolite transporter (DMT)-like permease